MGGTKAVSACKVLDADAGSWLSLPPLARARTRCAVVGKGSLLYVLGGETRHKQGRRQTRTPLADVDRFDADGWKWEMIASLPLARGNLAAVMDGGHVYTIGGFDGQQNVATMDRMHLKTTN